jgi:hypothetical protein
MILGPYRKRAVEIGGYFIVCNIRLATGCWQGEMEDAQ